MAIFAPPLRLTLQEARQVRTDAVPILPIIDTANESGNRTFTNTAYLDLDALTGGSGSISAVAVTLVTGKRALITIGCEITNDTSDRWTAIGYRVSGATTQAAVDLSSLAAEFVGGSLIDSRTFLDTGLTPGINTFELQARVTAGTGTVKTPNLIVQSLLGTFQS